MNLSEKELLEYNIAGLIPGPSETEQAFFERADYCYHLKSQITEILPQKLLFSSEQSHLDEILEEGCERARHFYDIYPTWVPLFFSNYRLPFWQGGCAWIFQQKEDSPTSAFFQIRQRFRNSKKYLGLYDRAELISHELSHVGRMKYEEPKYEEILAYRSSKSSFRRFFGPIIQSSYESTIFLLFLLLVLFLDFFTLNHGYENLAYLSLIGRLIILGMIGYGLIRLWCRQMRYKACLNNLRKIFFNVEKADAVIYRLTDKEIASFAQMTTEEIQHYADTEKTQTLRWKVIFEAYFKPTSRPIKLPPEMCLFPNFRSPIFTYFNQVCQKLTFKTQKKIRNSSGACIGHKLGFKHMTLSDHYDGIHFHNNPPIDHSFKDVLKWIVTRRPARWPKKIFKYPEAKPKHNIDEDELLITFVNHSTLLVQWGDIHILTDPIWSKRASPVQWLGPKRICEPGINFEDLPSIDLVLISHNHYDHMDLATLKQLQAKFQPIFITGLGNRDYLERKHFEKVIELDWWQAITPIKNLEVIFVPAQHFSSRNIFNKNKTLWGGFILRKESEVLYFAGDTAYTSVFKKLKDCFGPPKISFLPIGAFEPRWFMQIVHMSPEEAIQAHQDLGSLKSIGIHFGTFHLADEDFEAPVRLLKEGLKKNQISEETFQILKPGESLQG